MASVERRTALPRVQAVDFVDERTGWLGGDGAILATVDGGETWRRQYAGDQRIHRFSFLDRRIGWALGAGELLRTVDGGTTWTPLGAREEPLVMVDFLDARRGWGIVERSQVGSPALRRLARTSDGGSTWRVTAIEAQSVCFDDARAGWLGAGRQVWRTEDGGERWSAVFEPPVAEGVRWWATVACAGGASAYAQFAAGVAALGNSPYVTYHTADAGRSFTPVFAQGHMASLYPTVRAASGAGSYPALIAMTAPDRATFVGGSPGPIGVVTVAGAAIATRTQLSGGGGGLLGADFVDERTGWVAMVGPTHEPVVLMTRDGGVTWAPSYPSSAVVPTRAISPIDRRVAIGIGRLGDAAALLITSDGGRSWAAAGSPGEITSSRGGPLASFIDAGRGWVAGSFRLRATADGGRTWSDVDLPADATDRRGTGVSGVVRTGDLTGWMLANGALYRMDDGVRWIVVPLVDRLASALSCTDDACWVTLRSGQPMRYDRATGRTDHLELAREIAVHSPPNSLHRDGRSVKTASVTMGSQCRDFGLATCVRLLEPVTGGWREIRIPIAVSFESALSWLDAQNAWLTTGLAVYVTSDGGRSWRELP